MSTKTTEQQLPPPDSLERFLYAQEAIYDDVVAELHSGRKRSHWMWFIFPQIAGLGHSSTSRYYGIKSVEEARAYLHHPVLGKRLLECTQLLYALEGRSASEIFGYPDDVKLRSSMTLFAQVTEAGSIFEQVLEKYFDSESDEATRMIVNMLAKNQQGASRQHD
jgi:uncharacterized protein (DUF1810 family)